MFIGKITFVPDAILIALSVYNYVIYNFEGSSNDMLVKLIILTVYYAQIT